MNTFKDIKSRLFHLSEKEKKTKFQFCPILELNWDMKMKNHWETRMNHEVWADDDDDDEMRKKSQQQPTISDL